MKRVSWALVLGFVLISSAPAFAQDTCRIQRSVDDATGVVTLTTDPDFRQVLLREYEGARGEGNVSMSLAYQSPMIQMGIYYVGLEAADLEGDGELEVRLDGQAGPTLQAIGGQADQVEDAFIEVVAFNLSEDEFRQITEARRVRLRLPARRRLEREFRPEHLNCFKSFLEQMEQ